ncbi:alkaline phosphatase family protein [Fluviicola sp.]|uniref:LTA synthase family protein n=1 Tax=Fluviicola sp. TaxID=1917219 RepID=UPI002629F228|nr:alkaline phosphatase family protein [Fluviicola sp.]
MIYHIKGLLMDLLLCLLVSFTGSVFSILIRTISGKINLIFLHLFAIASILSNFMLIFYFVKTKQLLGTVFYQLSFSELITSANLESNIGFFSIVFPSFLISSYFILPRFIRKIKPMRFGSVLFGFLTLSALVAYPWKNISSRDYVGDMFINNKLLAFLDVTEKHFFSNQELQQINTSLFNQLDDSFFPDPQKRSNAYPLIHELEASSKFGAYLKQSPKGPPNIVIIIVESLSSFLVGENNENPCHLMPFLDSLSRKSLYFPNFISTCERTHNVLPAALISAPNPPEKQFMQKEEYPRHWSLISLLPDYHSRFYCGVDLGFCSMNEFMSYNQTDYMVESWESRFSKTRDGVLSIWGYADDHLFQKSFVDDQKHKNNNPKLDVFLTISNHEPYCFPQKSHYISVLNDKLEHSKATKKQREEIQQLSEVYASYLFSDEALKNYFQQAAKKADFDNTIFFVFGDHGNPLFPRSEIQKYQTPLLIYSPLLKKSGKFNSLISHNDLTPTILNYLRIHYPQLRIPKQVPFFGKEIAFEKSFKCNRTLPLISLDSETKHLIYNDHFQYEGQLFKIGKNLKLTHSDDHQMSEKLTQQLGIFKKMARYYHDYDKILPKELYKEHARKGEKIPLKYLYLDKLVKEGVNGLFTDVGPKICIEKGWKRIELELNCEIFLRNEAELRQFAKLSNVIERRKPNTLIKWRKSEAKLQEVLRNNQWNKVSYSLFVDVRKYSKKTGEYQFIYYLINDELKKLKFRKVNLEVTAWK